MPNIGTVLREEIARLSRKESRKQVDPAKKATAQHRRDIAELKRKVAQIESQMALLSRKVLAPPSAKALDATTKPIRFSAKRLLSQRNRLALSANDFGNLIGVSAQTIFNWERGVRVPRGEQVAKLAALRAVGKREVAARLGQIAALKTTSEHQE